MKSINGLMSRIPCNNVVLIILMIIELVIITGASYFHSIILGILGISFFLYICYFLSIDFKQEKEELADEILTQHEDLIELVQKTANICIRKLKTEDEGYSFFLSNETTLDWVIPYNDELVSYIEEYGYQKANAFIEAACLIKAIVENNCVVSEFEKLNNLASEIQRRILFDVNIEIAFQVGFNIISRPYFYKEIKDEKWIKVRPETESLSIDIPHGFFKANSLSDQIVWSISKDYLEGHSISIKQLSNMLHLIYLYNKDCKTF